MKTILISGCAGFIGQNLIKKFIDDYKVIGIDNLYSSNIKSIQSYLENNNFEFINTSITELPDIKFNIDIIFNLACPASPPLYQKDPLFTLDTNYIGTKKMLELARKKSAIFIQASTSEVYGDPLTHPQSEDYFGNVNTTGVRSCYDEGKRVAETLCYEFRKLFGVETRIVRIFNTYGPGMMPNDGRVVSNFLVNTINGKPLKIYGSGDKTRSFCYVDDMIEALEKVIKIDFDSPINLGNDTEISLTKLAKLIIDKYGENKIEFTDPIQDDPRIRKPNIARAKEILNWAPKISIEDGIEKTYNYFKKIL
jgi:UDP-glucuronate decarboxylase